MDGKPSVLIVDDSLTVRMDLCETFDSAGFAATPCETLAAARKALEAGPFSLVILDVILPDGDGIALLREIRGMPGEPLHVMLLSTEAEVCDRVRGLQTGADDYIGKPYDRHYLLLRARQLIGPAHEAASTSPNPRVLLIDGNTSFRRSFIRQLEGAGYNVMASDCGEDGLSKAFSARPDAILVDQLLAGCMGGIDGPGVIHRIKQDVTLRNTPCMLMTEGAAEDGEERSALDAGADAYLSKTTETYVILARIAAMLRSGRPERPLFDPPASSLLGAKKILAVDHREAALDEVATQLRADGYDVAPARSGGEAMQLLCIQPVDCILLHARMGGAESGNDICRSIKLRPSLRKIPLILLTATGDAASVVEAMNAGADDCVHTTSDFALLKARVRAQIRRKQFEDEERAIREELLHKELETARAKAAQDVAEARAGMVGELESKNRELEAFAHSVSHDLRAPLRSIREFNQAFLEDFGDHLPPGGREYLDRVQAAALRMGKLIDSLLEMSRTSRAWLRREPVDLSALARSVASELAECRSCNGDKTVNWVVQAGLWVEADASLARVVLHNLLANAWKFTGKTVAASVEVGASEWDGRTVYFVRDNGAGFEQARAKRLFQPFERMHAATDFPGTGIGLATVRRIVERHGGEIWAESQPGKGATFYFTLASRRCGS